LMLETVRLERLVRPFQLRLAWVLTLERLPVCKIVDRPIVDGGRYPAPGS